MCVIGKVDDDLYASLFVGDPLFDFYVRRLGGDGNACA